MTNSRLNLSINADKVSQLLAVVSAAAAKSPFTEQFFQRYQFLIATGDLLVNATGGNSSHRAAVTGEIGVCLQPTDALLSLCTAFLAGDGDFRIFDHEYSFSQSVETSVEKFDRYDSVINESNARRVHTIIFKDPEPS
ncbi:MAG TPA: hypothetical protein DCW74_04235 [Alteromonas australica]|uniref:Uncharacterized protein n=1 Tax=Alteromonas australica TaxID=589873 RepID=A0A350P0W2_9ALTE|nr:hypothetical protein [Alteromonas australica]